MRSRFAAFRLHDADYIIGSTHATHKDHTADVGAWREKVLFGLGDSRLTALEVLGPPDGEVVLRDGRIVKRTAVVDV